jgi:hypothetical protein
LTPKKFHLHWALLLHGNQKKGGRGCSLVVFSILFYFFPFLFLVVSSHHIAKNILKKLYCGTNSCFFILKNSPKNEFLIQFAKNHLNCVEHEGELKVFFLLSYFEYGQIWLYIYLWMMVTYATSQNWGEKKEERKKDWRKGGCNGMQAQSNQLALGSSQQRLVLGR